jgi:hypothetical protein
MHCSVQHCESAYSAHPLIPMTFAEVQLASRPHDLSLGNSFLKIMRTSDSPFYILLTKNKPTPWRQNPKVHHRVYKSPPPVHTLSRLNWMHTLPASLRKIHFDPFLSSSLRSSEWSLSFGFSHQNLVHFYISLLLLLLYRLLSVLIYYWYCCDSEYKYMIWYDMICSWYRVLWKSSRYVCSWI